MLGNSYHMPQRNRSSGFTLLELLVALVIIALLASVAISSTSDDADQTIASEAIKLRQLLLLASEEAVLESREIGVFVDKKAYQFAFLESTNSPIQRLKDRQWSPMNDDMFRQRKWPERLRLQLLLDDDYEAPELATNDDGEAPPIPAIWIYSTGEVSPFEIRLKDKDSTLVQVIRGTQSGIESIEQEEVETDG